MRKIFLIGLLCISLLGITFTSAWAWPTTSIGGDFVVKWGSITVEDLFKRVNVNDEWGVFSELRIGIQEIQVTCCNGGDQCGGLGVPFSMPISLTKTAKVPGEEVTTNGQWIFSETFTNEDIIDAVEEYMMDSGISLCQNDNWWINWNAEFYVTKVHVEIIAYSAAKDPEYAIWGKAYGDFELNFDTWDYKLVEGSDGIESGECPFNSDEPIGCTGPVYP